ncbi:type I restriction-modification system subunit M N-terminal domain-containing protein [Aeriscardovia aeriphila]|uniref:type I restriction-modification system subunit M N-terminal domain-containing protein n=1 Tax=Aeriscardovia aeriphila TaxID=218139 RepID=UPI00179BA2D2|nr:type I restriction-modification system subunit M N-terminal domain-containing protein [Aeriscardovia aeriphila]NYI26167.1 type I restriction-modification system DNA methylase subunit [Aeriscardovia aeriphila]
MTDKHSVVENLVDNAVSDEKAHMPTETSERNPEGTSNEASQETSEQKEAIYRDQAAALSSKLWAIANDLRGNMDSTKFRNYILGTIFYSYLSQSTENYMKNLLKNEDSDITYEQAFADDDYRPAVEQMSLAGLGFIIKPENLYRELVRKIVSPRDDADRFSIEDYERAVNELVGSTIGQPSESDFSGLFNDMKLQDPDLGDSVADRTALISKVILRVNELDLHVADQQFDVLGTAYMILIGKFASDAGKKRRVVSSSLRLARHAWWQLWLLSAWMRRRRWAIAPAVLLPCCSKCRSI